MRKLLIRVLALLVPIGALAVSEPNLLDRIHHVNDKEIALANLALEKSQSPDVRQFAQEMIIDHTGNDQKLTELATKKGVTLTPYQPAGYEKSAEDRLARTTGVDFDVAYAKEMISGHQHFLDDIQRDRKRVKDADTGAFVDALIPTVKEHEKHAMDLKSKLEP